MKDDPWNWPTLEKVNYDVCGCGECEACLELTKELKRNQTPEQKQFDRDMQRIYSETEDED